MGMYDDPHLYSYFAFLKSKEGKKYMKKQEEAIKNAAEERKKRNQKLHAKGYSVAWSVAGQEKFK